MPLLLDYSQVAIATIFQFQDQLQEGKVSPDAENIIRHAVLTGVKGIKQKFGNQYGEVVLACDGQKYWRKSLFPHYKAGRAKARSKSSMDWHVVFDMISKMRDDIRDHFPYKVLHFDTIEADDIIAVISQWLQENEHIDRGLFEEPQPVMIVSSDGDYKQLHRYANVKQWSPIQKKMVTGNPKEYLMQHIAKGDTGDGIPNVLSPDEVFITEGVRQGTMTAKRLAEFVEMGRDACRTDVERRNWDRNNQLINFDMIPDHIRQTIIDGYTAAKPKGDKMSIYNYFVKHRCRLLLNDIDEF